MLGKNHTEETKRKIGKANSIALRGRIIPDSVREKLSIAHRGKSAHWLVGKTLSKERKAKISKTLKGRSYVDLYGEEKALEMRKLRRTELKGRVRPNISACWDNPEFVSKRGHSGKRYTKGYFKSYKSGETWLYFASSYELHAYLKLEHDKTILTFSRCLTSIKYVLDGITRRYIPDIDVVYVDGTRGFIEVKPDSRMTNKVVRIKTEAAQNYCSQNGLRFTLWGERIIFGDKND